MRKAQMHPCHAHGRCPLCRTPVQPQRGTPARQVRNLDLPPAHTLGDAGTQRLGTSLLRRKTCRQALRCSVPFALAVRNLGSGKDALQKAFAMALHRVCNPADLAEIDTCPNNHLVTLAPTLAHSTTAGTPQLRNSTDVPRARRR